MRFFFYTVVVQPLSVISFRPARTLGASVTVDDTDSSFIYLPSTSWHDVEGLDAFDFGGSHKLTEDPAAYAEITFSFTSFSFVSALYPYQIAVIIFVDDATEPVYIDLQDYNTPAIDSGPGTVPHQVVYTSPVTKYAQHTLRISIPDDELYAVIDQITFEIPDVLSSTILSTTPQFTATLLPSTAITSPPFNPTTSSTSTDNVSTVHAERKAGRLATALGVVGTILGLFLLFLLLWWYRRRSRRLERHERATLYQSPPPESPELKTSSLRDGRASTTILDGRATVSGLDGLSTPQVRLISPQPIVSKDTVYAPRQHHSLNQSDGASTPRSTTLAPSLSTPVVPRPAKLHSSYPVNRADSSSYYDAAHSIVGAAPGYTSRSMDMSGVPSNRLYGYGDGLGDEDYDESREKLG